MSGGRVLTRRLFSGGQRLRLYLASDGRCSICGGELGPDWEADHRLPYSMGGATRLWNGRATCRQCNRARGNKLNEGDSVNERTWQQSAAAAYRASPEIDFLVHATMGAGKTRFACARGRELLDSGIANCIVVVAPNLAIAENWKNTAAKYGVQLDNEFRVTQTVMKKGFHGVVVTYSAVAHSPRHTRWFAKLCRDYKVMVVFDEIHHCEDASGWGSCVRDAFQAARKRLALTGTAFRSNEGLIPFLKYGAPDINGRCAVAADVSYTYTDALLERHPDGTGVCREVFFRRNEGELTYVTRDGVQLTTRFEDTREEHLSIALRAALDPTPGGWLDQALRAANEELSEIRQFDPRAGGLVVCIDQTHARLVAGLLRKIAAEEPTLVISDEPGAIDELESYTQSTARWVVAVRMLGEGVDITRLRGLVHATNVLTELSFRQETGRILRWADWLTETQYGFVVMPDHPVLRAYAERFRKEIADARKRQPPTGPDAGGGGGASSASAVGGTGFEPVGTVGSASGDVYFPYERDFVKSHLRASGRGDVPPEWGIDLLRATGTPIPQAGPTVVDDLAEEPLIDVLNRLKDQLKRACDRLVGLLIREFGNVAGGWFVKVRRWVAVSVMGSYTDSATVEQLKRGVETVHRILATRAIPKELRP